MRLWSLHPCHLDRQGLLALWREGLLARAVLHGATRGYRNHPQLQRFKSHPTPERAIDAYLAAVAAEARARGYAFDTTKIDPGATAAVIPVATGQLAHEWQHLLRKLAHRSPEIHQHWREWERGQPRPLPRPHPLFALEPGPIADWEKPGADASPPPAKPRR